MPRSNQQKIKDFVTFPLRAVTLLQHDRWGLSSLRTERFDYVSREVIGYCLDVGCGQHNLFVSHFLQGQGKGIDIYPYEGLTEENVVEDITHFPFPDASFDSVTLIANINHIPKSLRDVELSEAYRCLKPGGNIIVTMGNPLAEVLVHQLVFLRARLFGDRQEDTEREMHEDEEYYLTDSEIVERLHRARFRDVTKKHFLTQWGLNHLFVAWKK